MKLPKVVFDTNIFISAILFDGNPRTCLELAREGKIELITSKAILLELAEKLNTKFNWNESDVENLIAGIGKFAIIVEPKLKIGKITADIDDNMILEAANECNAEYIISGDKRHILPLKKFGKTSIITASEFVKLIDKEN